MKIYDVKFSTILYILRTYSPSVVEAAMVQLYGYNIKRVNNDFVTNGLHRRPYSLKQIAKDVVIILDDNEDVKFINIERNIPGKPIYVDSYYLYCNVEASEVEICELLSVLDDI